MNWISSRYRRSSIFSLYVWTLLGTTSVMALAAVSVSKAYWGYWFQRPGILSELDSLTTVEQVIPVVKSDVISTEFKVDANYSKKDAYLATDYYFLDERHWVTLVDKGLLPNDFGFEQDLGIFKNFHQQLQTNRMLATLTAGYESEAETMQGVITVGTANNGAQLALVSLKGGQVSNDHYPYYEMVFHIDPSNSTLTFVRGQRFFYDIAGMEGAEWQSIWLIFLIFALCLVLPMLTLGLFIREKRQSYAQMPANDPKT